MNKSSEKPTEKEKEKEKTKVRKVELKFNLDQFFNRGLLFFLIFLLFLPFFFSVFSGGQKERISLSQMVSDVRDKKVDSLTVSGADVTVKYKDGATKVTRKEDNQELLTILKNANIDPTTADIKVENLSLMEMGWQLFINVIPIVLMAVIFLVLFRQARGAQDGIMGIGRSKAKLFVKGKQDTKFTDVGGMDEAKKELEEIVDFMKNPKKYKKVGARTPKGVLLVGPSGTGKCVTGDTIVWTNKGLMDI